MMKKEMLVAVLVFWFAAGSVLGMESPQKSKTVKMFHCARSKEIARLILKEGIKSRSQLVREGRKTFSFYKPFPDHDDNIYFQYINEHDLEKIEPGLWDNWKAGNRFLYCVAMEFDPDETMVYNPDLRFWPPEDNCGYDITARDPIYVSLDVVEREDIYKKSGMPLRQYIAKKEYFEKEKHHCFRWQEAIQDPFTADLRCVKVSNRYTVYDWNEHTIKRDRIDPSEFAQ